MNRFAISDIYGAYKALLQVLKRSNFRYDNDMLICLGDTCDRWPETFECFEELLKIRNLIYILGNHDEWLRIYAESSCSQIEPDWIRNGGFTTLRSYKIGKAPTTHVHLLSFAPLFFELDNMMFVHAGFRTYTHPSQQDKYTLLWDRNLVEYANQMKNQQTSLTTYDKIFTGHTPTLGGEFNSTVPLILQEIRMIDTGAAAGGRLTIINIDTDEYFQSDPVKELYPEIS